LRSFPPGASSPRRFFLPSQWLGSQWLSQPAFLRLLFEGLGVEESVVPPAYL